MNKNFDINCPVGSFEDIKDFDLKEFGDIENPYFLISSAAKEKMLSLASYRLQTASQLTEEKQYDVAIEVTKSALWLLEILSRR